MPMSDEEAMNRAKVIVDKFDMSLRDRGQSAYAQLQAMIQVALIEATRVLPPTPRKQSLGFSGRWANAVRASAATSVSTPSAIVTERSEKGGRP